MTRKFFLAFLFAIAALGMSATKPVTVTFNFNEDAPLAGMLGVLDACQVTANIHTSATDYKYYELWLVKKSRENTTRMMAGYIPVKPDSTLICITAMPKDSATVHLTITPFCGGRKTIPAPTFNSLLIECFNDNGYETGDTIPLAAYSRGKEEQFQLPDGTIAKGYDICGVRRSMLHPEQWQKAFDLDDYIYIEAVPVKEIDYDRQ